MPKARPRLDFTSGNKRNLTRAINLISTIKYECLSKEKPEIIHEGETVDDFIARGGRVKKFDSEGKRL